MARANGNDPWDCIVVGGGAAGLSAALVLGRARRRTLLVDAGRQSNLVAHGIGGLLGHDGRPPAELYELGRKELEAYPSVEVRVGSITSGVAQDDGFVLELDDGEAAAAVEARRVLLAPGMDYRHPDVPGLAERWGRSVFHCPFCHGWEVRDGRLAVLDPGPDASRRALLLRTWSDDVTVLTNAGDALDDAARAQLRDAGIDVDDRPVVGVLGDAPELDGVVLADGDERPCDGLLVATTLHQRSQLAAALGAQLAPPNPIVVDGIVVDAMQQTTVPGLFAAGDAASSMPSVATAIASGSAAAAHVVHSLAAH